MKSSDGIALPVALFGLIVVSILMTSALVTSSTELALSRAHQAGTEELYAAAGAVERFVAQRASTTLGPEDRMVAGAYLVSTQQGDSYSVSVARLFQGAPQAVTGGFRRSELFSLLASPSSGRGRSTGAFLEVFRVASDISFNIDAGLTLGSDASISGSATVDDGSGSAAICDGANAEEAVRHARGTQVIRQGSGSEIQGVVVQDTSDSAQLEALVLNGHDLPELSELATFHFGPMFGEAAFADGVSQWAGSPEYRWGCPAHLVEGCTPEQAANYPTVVIDADGGAVDLTGQHGQGILVVRNGNLEIGGDFRFAGIVLVEGSVHLTGTAHIEGGVVAIGNEALNGPGGGSSVGGSSRIHFDRCQISEAQRALTISSLSVAPQTMDNPTFAWFEVVR